MADGASAKGGVMQTFPTGATRSSDTGKIDYEGFLSMAALDAFGSYMLKHQIQANGSVRSSSNWKSGMPLVGDGSYTKALLRHTLELVGLTVGFVSARIERELPHTSMRGRMQDTACAIVFNIQGWLHEFLKDETFGEAPKSPPYILYNPDTGLDRHGNKGGPICK